VLLPISVAFAGRHDGIAAGRIDLRRSAAGDHADVGVCADDRDAVNLGGVKRQLAAFVLQQHGALFFDCSRDFESTEDVDDALPRRIVDHAGGEHGAQDAVDVIVEFGSRDFSGLNRFLELIPVKKFAGFFVV